ncbi:hypothetical protein [Sphingopyxis panaciterrae]
MIIRAILASGIFLMAMPASAFGQTPNDVLFNCWSVKSDGKLDDKRPPDMVLTRQGKMSDASASWLVQWAGKEPVSAMAFEANYGSVGGSTGLRWSEDGRERVAFVSYSDIKMANGSEAFWLSFDKPSLWQPPGYVCDSGSSQKSEGAS